MAATKLAKYREMRDFNQTAEPSGDDASGAFHRGGSKHTDRWIVGFRA